MKSEFDHVLPTATPDEFLPPLSRWSTLGGMVLLFVFGGCMGLAAILPYKQVVRVPATVRPEGDIRVVEAAIQGTVQQIMVQSNDKVQQGAAIATLRDHELRLQEKQLQADLEPTQQQLAQIQTQLQALDVQIAAETQVAERRVAAATARANVVEREYQDRQAVTQLEVKEAEAAVRFAQEELNRYQQLAETGTLSVIQILEKRAALDIATARLKRAQALLDPSSSAIEQARQEVAQAIATGKATLAKLEQDQKLLSRQQLDLQKQLQSTEQSLQQLRLNLEKLTIRAPMTGTIQELNLRNPGQVVEPGEVVAQISPAAAPLTIQAQVNQNTISQLQVGQKVSIRIDSCVYTDYGVITGHISKISPDVKRNREAATAANSYYEVAIAPQAVVLRSAVKEACQLQAGMAGQADIIMREETLLASWLRQLRLITDL